MKTKRALALMVSCLMILAAFMAGCGGGGGTTPAAEQPAGETPAADAPAETPAASGGKLNVWSFTDEVPNMLDKFKELNPDFPYDFEVTIIATTDGAYQPALDLALAGGEVDLYCAEAAFVLKYTQGDAAHFAAPYADMGIDVSKVQSAEIAPYSVEIGSNGNGDVVGLGYQATGGAFIYRRSIAKDVWGTDEPSEVSAKLGKDWNSFFAAAEEMKEKGYGMVSGDGDIWHAIENSSATPWVIDGKLNIDPKREEFLDLSMQLKENNYSNDTEDWQDPWYADMAGIGEKEVFGFYGPAWLINYVMAGNSGGSAIGEGTYGDWAVCAPNVGFFWGGTWILGSAASEHKEAVGQIIEWITLDDSEDGLQYMWANGLLSDEGTKDSVASGTVMAKSNGSIDFLNGQDMFEAFIPANQYANGENLTQYDETINIIWRDQVRAYTHGEKDRDQALADFKQNVKDKLDLEVD